jgi:acetyl esterase
LPEAPAARHAPYAAHVLPALRPLLDGDGESPITDLTAARAQRRALARRRAGPAPAVREVVDVTHRAARLRLYEPVRRTSAGTLVVVHGGGWVWGGIEETDVLSRALANGTGRLTVSVGYRLAPEHPYPAAVRDVSGAVTWLRGRAPERGVDGGDVVLVGLSAGGTLAAAVSARLRTTSGPISAQVLVHPMLDPSGSSGSARRYASVPALSRHRATWFWDQYAPGPARLDAGAVPALEPDLAGMPPTYVVLAEVDVLRDEGLAYADRLRAASVPVASTVWPGTVHGFLGMAGLVPDVCAAAVADIAAWIAAQPARARSGTARP